MDFHVARIVHLPALWPHQTDIRVGFLNGKPKKHKQFKAIVNQHIAPLVNLNIVFVDSCQDATIRVHFNNENENWSVVGNAAREVHKKDKPTMDLGIRKSTSKKDRKSTILHEFLHALGFEHEHQSRLCPLKINIKKFKKNQGWSRKEAIRNLKKLVGKDYDYSDYDPLSMMYYFFLPEEIRNEIELPPPATSLSIGDKLMLRRTYPKAWVPNCHPDYRLPFHYAGTFYWVFYMVQEKRIEIFEETKKGGSALKWRAGRKCDNQWDSAKIIYEKNDKAFERPILYRERTRDKKRWFSKRKIYDLTFDKIETDWV